MEAKATEVKNVQTHKNSYGKEIVVTEGRICLIETKESPIRGKLCKTYYKDGSSGYHIADNPDCNITEYGTVKESFLVNPVIISEIEKIEAEDWIIYTSPNGRQYIYQVKEKDPSGYICTDSIKPLFHEAKKIISFPQNFSPKQLQAIVDGKIKEDDSVLVECESVYDESDYVGINSPLIEKDKFQIKLNDKNQITIHPAVKEKNNKINLSKEELIDFCEQYYNIRANNSLAASDLWLEKKIKKLLFLLLPILLFFNVQTTFAGNSNKTIDSLIKRSETAPNALEKAKIYNYLRHYYIENGNYPSALDNSLKALDIYEKKKDKENVFVLEGNTAYLYFLMQDYETSMRYLNKASTYNDKDDYILFLKSAVCGKMKKYDLGLYYAKKCIQYSKDSSRIALACNIAGTINENIGQLDSALAWYFKALKIFESYDSTGLGESYGSIGDTYYKLKQYDKALFFENKSLELSIRYGLLTDARDTQKKLSEIYQATGNCKKSFEFYKKYTILKDSLISEKEIKESTRIEEGFKFEKQREIQKLEQQKKDIIKQAEVQHQRNIKNGFIFGLCVTIILSVFIFRIYRRTLRQKVEIQSQKILVEKKAFELKEKQDEIDSSIRYAQRIQQATLPTESFIKSVMPEHFIIFEPKDVLSGDAYFVDDRDDKIFWASLDFTGHGLPSSLLSALGLNILTEIVKNGETVPSKILDKLNQRLNESLHKVDDNSVRDGMDITLTVLDKKSMTLNYAGANNCLIIVSENNLIETRGDKMAIGQIDKKDQYTNHEIKLKPGDCIYSFSDGVVDLHDKNNKKFMKKRFRELLLSVNKESMEDQKKIICEVLHNYCKDAERVDDIVLIGVRA